MAKTKKTGSDYNAPILKIPDHTLFSDDAKTGKPYFTVAHAEQLVYKHLNLTAKNLIAVHEIDDLKQELLLKLLTATYDPKLSAPNTFAIMCMRSQCARIWERTYAVRDRHKETSDFVMFADEDGEDVLATQCIGVEEITPEDWVSAKQTIEEFYNNPPKYPKSKNPKLAPEGYSGYRGSRKENKD